MEHELGVMIPLESVRDTGLTKSLFLTDVCFLSSLPKETKRDKKSRKFRTLFLTRGNFLGLSRKT